MPFLGFLETTETKKKENLIKHKSKTAFNLKKQPQDGGPRREQHNRIRIINAQIIAYRVITMEDYN